MVRQHGWTTRLSLFLRSRRKMPFAWGSNDCITFAADAVKEITGEDLIGDYRGQYSSQDEATALVESLGGMSKLISDRLGRGHRDIMKAKRGDVVLMKLSDPIGLVIGIVDDSGTKIAFPLADDNKLCRLPLRQAWRIWSY